MVGDETSVWWVTSFGHPRHHWSRKSHIRYKLSLSTDRLTLYIYILQTIATILEGKGTFELLGFFREFVLT